MTCSVLKECLKKYWPKALYGLFVVVMVGWAMAESHRPITYIYWNAARDWWASLPVYNTEGIHGFIYFPSSVFLFAPFSWLPLPVADHLWRIIWAVLLAWGMVRAGREMNAPEGERMAYVALALAIPTLSINLLRSQWELAMFVVVLHAAVDLAQEKNKRAGALLAFAVALKPLALVPALLFCAVKRRALPTFLLGMLAVVGLPFLHPSPAFVAEQYGVMIPKLLRAAAPGDTPWFDLVNLLRALHIDPSYQLMTLGRILGACATLGLGFWGVKRLDPKTAVFALLFLACAYLALFNPRTEEGTYANIALLLGLFAGVELRLRPWGLWGYALIGLILALCTHFAPGWLYRPSKYALKQAVTILSLSYIAWMYYRRATLVKIDRLR